MNIHEYQAKQLFERFNVATPKGAPAETPEEAEKVAAGLNTAKLVVKAQIHAGGRGKGTFTNGFKGGVKLCTTPAEARELANRKLEHYEFSSGLAQIAIVLASAAIITGISALVWLSIGLGVVGALLAALGFAAPTMLPFMG